MAYIQVNFLSDSLRKVVPLSIILPNDTIEKEQNIYYKRNTKTLYLLHGFSGNHTDWLNGTSVSSFAKKYNVAIVCPSGDNSFYLDKKMTGGKYETFVGKEIVEYITKTFNLSKKREDTFIGGFSMGGYGALHTGLKYNQTFSKVIGLSSALVVKRLAKEKDKYIDGLTNHEYSVITFGDLDKIMDSDINIEHLISDMIKNNKKMPELFLGCGTEDFLLDVNRDFHSFLSKNKVAHTYVEDSGSHDWFYWNKMVEPFMKWLVE